MMSEGLVENHTIHKHFEKVAEKFLHHCAIRTKNEVISYYELNERSNTLAKHLLKQGVCSKDVVCINMSRSSDMVVALLAVSKIGGAYLPLASENPLQRNLILLNESNVKYLITDKECNVLIESNRIAIWAREAILDSESVNDITLDRVVSDNDCCYIMYTSGTSGAPKGVMIPHRAVVRLVIDANYVDITAKDTMLQFAPIAFDASTFEIWGALLNGATLYIYPEETLNITVFSKVLSENKITIVWLTAALFHLIADNEPRAFCNVKTLLAGGDILNYKCINRVFDYCPELTIINGYGPTENTTFSCCYSMNSRKRPQGRVPIGTAITGTKIHILDSDFNSVMQGKVGELYLSGKGVALGYMKDDVNSIFFVNEDLAPDLIYKTGDLVFENKQGQLEYIGRQDDQIKLRGYRVSLEEIQRNIISVSYINDAVVMVKRFGDGEVQLICNLRLEEGVESKAPEIKQKLLEFMPRYMVPSVIRVGGLDKVNKNGKVDKTRLLESIKN